MTETTEELVKLAIQNTKSEFISKIKGRIKEVESEIIQTNRKILISHIEYGQALTMVRKKLKALLKEVEK